MSAARSRDRSSPTGGVVVTLFRKVFSGTVVLVADELDDLLVGHDALVAPHGERLRIRLRIVDGHIDLEGPEVRTTKAFRHLQCFGIRASVDVEPARFLVPAE